MAPALIGIGGIVAFISLGSLGDGWRATLKTAALLTLILGGSLVLVWVGGNSAGPN